MEKSTQSAFYSPAELIWLANGFINGRSVKCAATPYWLGTDNVVNNNTNSAFGDLPLSTLSKWIWFVLVKCQLSKVADNDMSILHDTWHWQRLQK